MRCRVLLGCVVVLAAATLGVSSASAADPTPTPAPTPSVSPPSQQQIDDAKAALDRLRNQGKSRMATPTSLSQVAAPTDAPDARTSLTSRISDEAWWTLGAGLLVLLVASETTRLGVRRAKHRKGP